MTRLTLATLLVSTALGVGCSSPSKTPADAGQPGCTSVADCTSSGPCQTAICDTATGQCSERAVPDGTVPVGTTQTPGDCQKIACVAGAVGSQEDLMDLPPPSNECLETSCSGGKPSTPPRAANAPCSSFKNNQPGFCDGNGQCAQCTRDDQCPGPSTDCQHPICHEGSCETAFAALNTVTVSAPPQMAGDCTTIICDGNGTTKDVPDDNDKPQTTNVCISLSCVNGQPHTENEPKGTDCGASLGSLTCNGKGDCGCQGPGDCAAPETCGGGGTPLVCGCTATACAAEGLSCGSIPDGCAGTLDCNNTQKDSAETDVDCGGPDTQCATRCAQGRQCSVGSDCASGFCVDGVCCNTACDGTCEACSAAKKGAGPDGVCGGIVANSDPDDECAQGTADSCGLTGSCNGAGACAFFDSSTTCAPATCASSTILALPRTCNGIGLCQPPNIQDCSPYFCVNNACKTSCVVDVDCVSGRYCDSSFGQCQPRKALGAACFASNQCASGFCVDGLCCDTPCNGTCQACSAAKKGSGADGTCGGIAAGFDPDNECASQSQSTCGTDGACNGTGACRLYGSGTPCAAASCSGSSFTPARTCNGTGTCSTAAPVDCTPLSCTVSGCQ